MSHVYITEDGARISKRGGYFVLSRCSEVLFEVPEETLESLTLIGRVELSSGATEQLLQKGIPVTWLSKGGYFFGRLESTRHCNAVKQAKQVVLTGGPLYLSMGKSMIKAKVHNQQVLLRRYNRELERDSVRQKVEQLSRIKHKIMQAPNRSELMGNEGLAARIYFEALSELIEPEFRFNGRTKRPPQDPFNAVIGFGYTLLLYELYTALSNVGLHPYFGCLHALKHRHPALASDLMEEWRPVIIDSLAMSLFNRHQLKAEHFEHTEDGVYLNREGRYTFLKAYEKRLRTSNKYSDEKQSFRQSLVNRAEMYSLAIMEDDESCYQPMRLR